LVYRFWILLFLKAIPKVFLLSIMIIKIVWETIQTDLPPLKPLLNALLP
jgi:hypothetical protein